MPLSVDVTDNYTTPELTTTPTTTVTPTCCMTTPPSTSTTTPTSLSPSQIMCPGGWEVFQGSCYYFANDVMTWPQAQVNDEKDCRFLQSSVDEFSYFNYNVKYVIA